MRKRLMLIAICLILAVCVKAQSQPYGVVDTADLRLKLCDFEKDANAMVLFDKAEVKYKFTSVVMVRHKQIKIFDTKGTGEADIRIEYAGVHRDEFLTDIKAQTINLEEGKINYTPVDQKQIYDQVIDKEMKAIVFSFPNVKPGSILELTYKWVCANPYNFPDWFFQGAIPCRYSEFNAGLVRDFTLSTQKKIYQKLIVDTAIKTGLNSGKHTWAMANIKSYKEEPYMDYPDDYLQCILTRIDQRENLSWKKVGGWMLEDDDFGKQLKNELFNEDVIINNANKLNTDKEKIRYLFDTVRNAMKWNKVNSWYTIDGTRKAWKNKTGNCTEINLILYHLLTMAKVNGYLLSIRTRNKGKLQIQYPSLQFNKTVVCCPIDSATNYVLDASEKLNTFSVVPEDLAGLYALQLDLNGDNWKLYPLKAGNTRDVIFINGNIEATGKLEGTAQISSSTYSRQRYLKQYDLLGKSRYIDSLEKSLGSLKISSLRIDNVQNDTLPLNQSFNISYDLTEPDGGYMYFNPNFIADFKTSPFLAATRVSNIDFGCLRSYSISGRYKIPANYKVEALPKPVSLQMPDKSIIFRRTLAEQGGVIVLHYAIDYKRSLFESDEYPQLHEFYKRMYELINEQIVLKKL